MASPIFETPMISIFVCCLIRAAFLGFAAVTGKMSKIGFNKAEVKVFANEVNTLGRTMTRKIKANGIKNVCFKRSSSLKETVVVEIECNI